MEGSSFNSCSISNKCNFHCKNNKQIHFQEKPKLNTPCVLYMYIQLITPDRCLERIILDLNIRMNSHKITGYHLIQSKWSNNTSLQPGLWKVIAPGRSLILSNVILSIYMIRIDAMIRHECACQEHFYVSLTMFIMYASLL